MVSKRLVFCFLAIAFIILLSNFFVNIKITVAGSSPGDDSIPLKWGVVVMGGYDYYRDLTYNAIRRIEKIMQGRGVPYDLMRDNDIVAPSDNPPSGTYSLQYADGTLKYQALVLLFDYEPTDSSGVNQNYIYSAVGNGTNVVLFNRVASAVPSLLNLAPSDFRWDWAVVTTSHVISKTFNDGIREYSEGSSVTLGLTLQYHTVIQKTAGLTEWFTKTWESTSSIGMANTTYGAGKVWYLGYCLNEFRMDCAALKYPQTWEDAKMAFWGHAINFAMNNVEEISVGIMPYKRWKGAWVIRVDMDTYHWKESFLPPESILQSGWVFDLQFNALGYARTTGTADLPLTSGSPQGYVGIPSSKTKYTNVDGVLQTDLIYSNTYMAIIYNSTEGGNYDRIRIDFNANKNFADDTEYGMWENITYPTVQGKLYWNSIIPNFANPQSINIGVWLTPIIVDNGAAKWRQYGADYGLSYSFHGWQHVPIQGGTTYPMWNGDQFVLDTTYITEKFEASRYWMKETFGGTGQGFEENQVVISHPFDATTPETNSVIDALPWILLSYSGQEEYVGFGKTSADAKYTLSSSRVEYIDDPSAFSAIQDMVRTLYPTISTYQHFMVYNEAYSFPPYTDSIKPASPQDAFTFWLNAKNMLENISVAYYQSDKIVLEFNANTDLTEFVWKFPLQLQGKEFYGFTDSKASGQIKHVDGQYVYIEFSQGQGDERIEVNYGPPPNYVDVTVTEVTPEGSGTTTPTSGVHHVAENSLFSVRAIPSSGYTFDRWKLDEGDVGSANPYSFNVGTLNHSISPVFEQIPMVAVTVNSGSPAMGGVTDPSAGLYEVAENSLFSVRAIPSSGYTFDRWKLDEGDVGSANPYSFNVGTLNHSISPVFEQILSVQIDNCDSLSNWQSSSSPSAVLSIDTSDFKEGTGSIVATTTTPPQWNSYLLLQKSMDFSGASSLQMWIKVSDASKTLRLMIASDWNNYNIYAITGLTSNTWVLITINLSTPISKTGTVNMNSISFIRFEYTNARTSAFFKVDDIQKTFGLLDPSL